MVIEILQSYVGCGLFLFILVLVFEKSLQYVKRFSRYKNPDSVRQAREILSRYQLAEFELCVLGNLCPETVEEATAMVPSIKVPCQSLMEASDQDAWGIVKSKGRAIDDEAIEKMLNDLPESQHPEESDIPIHGLSKLLAVLFFWFYNERMQDTLLKA
ncbi:hypothetical protein TEA_004492 [Camellia sinensis var. sinensis]|uniref:RNA polymerase Rpb4/RPC9 core domain-containing protein n=1 Tax=Camellia sinensis var. sinensis TaxID=542762 RepID=A0A4S4EAP4_CAMSN|nr:hypothetical protein TEA_004492 [Camellia sinensis var. sinensis]